MVLLDLSIVNVALPAIRTGVGFSEQSLQYIVSLYALPFGAFLILAGRLGDLLGRKRLFMVGVGVFAFASLVCGVAPTPEFLLAARAVQGLGAALMSPTSLALITTIFAGESERARALGVWGTMSAVGGSLGFVLGGVMVDALGGSSVFFVNALLGLIVLVPTRALLPESRAERESGSLDVAGAALLVLALALLIYGLSRGQSDGFSSPIFLGLLGATIAAFVGFAVVESRVKNPLVPLGIFRVRALTGATLAGLLLTAMIAGESFFASLYMQGVLGYTGFATGMALLAQNIAFFVSAQAGAPVAVRFGAQRAMVGGFLLAGAGCLLLTRITPFSTFWVDLLPGFILFGLGIGGTLVALTIAGTSAVSAGEQGLASGLITTSQQIGSAIGIALLATLAGAQTAALGGADLVDNVVAGYQLGFGIAAGLALLGVVVTGVMIAPAGVREVEVRERSAEG